MSSLFKKPTRKFRQRNLRNESDEENDEQQSQEQESIANESKPQVTESVDDDWKEETNQKKMPKKAGFGDLKSNGHSAGKSKLSFGEEDEEEQEFQVKPSNYSIRLTKKIQREKRLKEKELKIKNKLTAPNEENLVVNSNDGITSERSFESNSIEEPKSSSEYRAEDQILDGDEMDEWKQYCKTVQMEEDGEEDEEEDTTNEIGPKFTFKKLRQGAIPDPKTIDHLKRQRKLARDVDEVTFIPINQRKKTGFDQDDNLDDEDDVIEIANPLLDADQLKSRLIREDPNDIEIGTGDDVDADEERVDFCVDKSKIEKEKFKEAFYQAQEEDERASESEDSDVDERWQREQIGKVVRIQSGQRGFESVLNLDLNSSTKSRRSVPNYIVKMQRKPIASKEDILKRCDDKICQLESSVKGAENRLEHIAITIKSLKETIDKKEKNMSFSD